MRRRSQAGAATTNFVLDGQDVLLETDGGGTTQAAYTHRPGAYGPLVAHRRGGDSFFHHFDALGSTTELTSAAEAVTDTCRYYAFGETRASTGGTTNRYGFVGRLGYYSEPSLALQYLRACWYQPAAGRFLARDPSRGKGSPYPYVGGRPTVLADASGLQAGGQQWGWIPGPGHLVWGPKPPYQPPQPVAQGPLADGLDPDDPTQQIWPIVGHPPGQFGHAPDWFSNPEKLFWDTVYAEVALIEKYCLDHQEYCCGISGVVAAGLICFLAGVVSEGAGGLACGIGVGFVLETVCAAGTYGGTNKPIGQL